MHTADEVALKPILSGHRSGMAGSPVLVISHQHEVIRGRGIIPVIPLGIRKWNRLEDHQTFSLKSSMQFLHKRKQICLRRWSRFFKINANSAELISFHETRQR